MNYLRTNVKFKSLFSILIVVFVFLFIGTSCSHSTKPRGVAGEVGAPAEPTCHYIMNRQRLDSRSVKCEENKKWMNYGKTVLNKPAVIIHPSTEQDVERIVFIASLNNWQVRPVGSGHSWSQITKTDDILMATDRLVKQVYIDPKASTATVGAGHKLRDLLKTLESARYTLPNLGDITSQSIAGAISTNTHGTGLTNTGFAGGVTKIRIVDGNGTTHEASPRKNKDLFYSALSGAGMVGIITEVTIKVVPKFNIYAETQPTTIDHLFFEGGHGVWEKVARENQWFSFLWLVDTDYATVFSGIKATSTKLKAGKDNDFLDGLNRNFLTPLYSSLYVHNRKVMQRFIPPIYRIQRWINPRKSEFKNSKDALSKNIEPKHWAWNLETEFFFPVKYLPEFVFRMRNYFDAIKKEGRVLAAPMLGFRLVKGDHSYLSPTYIYKGYDEFVALSVFDHNKRSTSSQFIIDVKYILQSIVVDQKQLRMHIGKVYMDHPKDFWKRFAHWSKFKATRNKYDPKGIFLNPWTRNFFDEWAE